MKQIQKLPLIIALTLPIQAGAEEVDFYNKNVTAPGYVETLPTQPLGNMEVDRVQYIPVDSMGGLERIVPTLQTGIVQARLGEDLVYQGIKFNGLKNPLEVRVGGENYPNASGVYVQKGDKIFVSTKCDGKFDYAFPASADLSRVIHPALLPNEIPLSALSTNLQPTYSFDNLQTHPDYTQLKAVLADCNKKANAIEEIAFVKAND